MADCHHEIIEGSTAPITVAKDGEGVSVDVGDVVSRDVAGIAGFNEEVGTIMHIRDSFRKRFRDSTRLICNVDMDFQLLIISQRLPTPADTAEGGTDCENLTS